MSITKELRKYARGYEPTVNHKLLIIADHIDEEYERELREEHTKGYNDGFDEGFASADDWDVDHADELAEHGWVELPKDADGEPIHIGDVVHYDHDGVRTATPETVEWIAMGEAEVHISTNHHSYTKPSQLRHYRERPTVEDVLREFVKCWDDPAHYAKGELVEAFAAKLQLRED